MIAILRIYQVVMAIFLVVNIIKDVFMRSGFNNTRHFLKISKWVFYFGAISGPLLSVGVIAELEDIAVSETFEMNGLLIVILFSAIIAFCTFLALIQKIWRIEYNDEYIIFRNTFGITKRFSKKDVCMKCKKDMVKLYSKNKKITEWHNLMINMRDEMMFERYLLENQS